jgi:hypothetical protein
MKVTCIFRSPQNKAVGLTSFYFYFYFYFLSICFNRVFGRFVTSRRGVKKTRQKNFQKKSSGLITKNVALFPPFLPPPPPSVVLLGFCLSRFWAVRNKGSSKKRDKKIAILFPQPPKKVLT